jgi:hypothetical protein
MQVPFIYDLTSKRRFLALFTPFISGLACESLMIHGGVKQEIAHEKGQRF